MISENINEKEIKSQLEKLEKLVKEVANPQPKITSL